MNLPWLAPFRLVACRSGSKKRLRSVSGLGTDTPGSAPVAARLTPPDGMKYRNIQRDVEKIIKIGREYRILEVLPYPEDVSVSLFCFVILKVIDIFGKY